MILHHQSATMEEFIEDKDLKADQKNIMVCALKMLENIELQIQVTYDYYQLKGLYQHKEVIKKMIENNQHDNSSAGYG